MKIILHPIKAFHLCLLLTSFSFTIRAQDSIQPLKISAYAEVYHLYNFNKPMLNNQPSFLYSYNRHNEVNLNLGFIKAGYATDKLRANFALMTGTYAQANLASEPAVLRHIFEANIGIKLSSNKNVWIDAGIMPSHIGFESAVGKDCFTLTRSMLAENSPYYEAGVKLSFTSKDHKWFVSALLLNGWQRIQRIDGNSSPSFGTQLTYKPSQSVTINSSTFAGSVNPDSLKQWRYYHNSYGIFAVSKRLSLIAGFDIGAQQKIKGKSSMYVWYSPVIISRYKASDKIIVAARAEYYNDRNTVIISTNTPNGFQTIGLSTNLDYTLLPHALWRFELRMLKSKDRIFEKRNAALASTTTWLTTSIAVSF